MLSLAPLQVPVYKLWNVVNVKLKIPKVEIVNGSRCLIKTYAFFLEQRNLESYSLQAPIMLSRHRIHKRIVEENLSPSQQLWRDMWTICFTSFRHSYIWELTCMVQTLRVRKPLQNIQKVSVVWLFSLQNYTKIKKKLVAIFVLEF